MKNSHVSLFVLYFVIILFAGCGKKLPLTEQATADRDKYLKENKANAILLYLGTLWPEQKQQDSVDRKHDIIIKDLEYLISKGANVNAKNEGRKTPLHILASFPDGGELILSPPTKFIEYLISKGADVNAENEYGETPLHLAAENGSIETVKILVSKGADVNANGASRRLSVQSARWTSFTGRDPNNERLRTPLDFVQDAVSRNIMSSNSDYAKKLQQDREATVKYLKDIGAKNQ